MGSWTSDAQRALANRKEDFENGELERNSDYLYAAQDVINALTYLQMGSGHHPQVKDKIDESAKKASDILSRMSTWETMEESKPIPEDLKDELQELTEDVLEASMQYRDPEFELDSIRY